MRFCPQCSNEYESHIVHCVDCDVDLVDELSPSASTKPTDSSFSVQRLLAEDQKLAEFICSILRQNGIPVREGAKNEEGLGVVEIPGEFFSRSFTLLGSIPQLVDDHQHEEPFFRRYDPARDKEIRDHPILHREFPDLQKDGYRAISALLELIRGGSHPIRGRAAFLLLQLGESGKKALLEVLLEIVQKGEREWVGPVLREIRGAGVEKMEFHPHWVGHLRRLLESPQPKTRNLAAWVAGEFGVIEASPELIQLLHHPENGVEADEALVLISGEDLGFYPELPEKKKLEMIAHRKQWWDRMQRK